MHELLYPIKSSRAWWYSATLRTQARFQRTLLGSSWLGISNLLSVLVLAFVYGVLLKVPNPKDYFLYVAVGFTVWQFISTIISTSPTLLRDHKDKLLNTTAHPIFYFLEEWAFQIQTFLQAWSIVIVILAIFVQPSLLWQGIFLASLPILNLFLFCIGVQIFFALAGLLFQDLYQVVPMLLQLTFLSSPVLFSKVNLGQHQWIANLNPLFRILAPVREAAIEGHLALDQQFFLLALNLFACSLLMLGLGRWRQWIVFNL
jgi:lipopolysaccharide transport system permease protein